MINPLPIKRQGALLLFGAVAIHHAVHHIARVELLHKLQRARKANRAADGAQLLFIARGRLRAHAKLFGCAAHRRAVKAGRFKNNGGCILHDAAVFAAHHARYSHRLFRVRNDEHIICERALNAIQRGDPLAVFCTANDHAVPLQVAQVKSVHRLAIFEHDEICDIDNIVNRAHAARTQPLAQPARGGLDAHIFDDRAHIAIAPFRIQDGNAQVVIHIARSRLHLRHGHLERHLKGCRSLTREAQNRQAVRPVGGNFKLRDRIVEADRVMNIRAGRQIAVIAQNKDAILNCIGKIVRGQPQLAQRAEHAVARHATQLALFDLLATVHCGMIQRDGDKIALLQILRAGDDLEGVPLPRVDLADPEMIGIRVLFQR